MQARRTRRICLSVGERENEARYQRQTNTVLKDPERRGARPADDAGERQRERQVEVAVMCGVAKPRWLA